MPFTDIKKYLAFNAEKQKFIKNLYKEKGKKLTYKNVCWLRG